MYKRVLLKLSGEALRSETESLDFAVIERTAAQLARAARLGVEIGLVVGGGNIWRGRSSGEMERSLADQMGMLATCINALALQDTLQRQDKENPVKCAVLSALEMPRVCETFTKRRAEELLQTGHIVLFACGTGHPYFSTDTAAALRAAEIKADVLLLAKNVDAIYSADPNKDKNAVRYAKLTYRQVIEQGLQATDMTAITMCAEQSIPLRAFGLKEENAVFRAITGEEMGTWISK